MNPIGGRGGMKRAADHAGEQPQGQRRDFRTEADSAQPAPPEHEANPAAAIVAQLNSGLITSEEAECRLAALPAQEPAAAQTEVEGADDDEELKLAMAMSMTTPSAGGPASADPSGEPTAHPNPFLDSRMQALAEQENREMAMAIAASVTTGTVPMPEPQQHVSQTCYLPVSEKSGGGEKKQTAVAVDPSSLTEEQRIESAIRASQGLPPLKMESWTTSTGEPPKQPSWTSLQKNEDRRPSITLPHVAPIVQIGEDDEEDKELEFAKKLSLEIPDIDAPAGGPPSKEASSEDSEEQPYLASADALRRLREIHVGASSISADHDVLKEVDNFYEALEASLRHDADVLDLNHLPSAVFEQQVAAGHWNGAMEILEQSRCFPAVIVLPQGSHLVPYLPAATKTLQLVNPSQALDLWHVPDGAVVELVYTDPSAQVPVTAPPSIVVRTVSRPPELLAKFDELHRKLDQELSSGKITLDQRRELRSVLNALWRSATSKEGYLDVIPCPLPSLRQALELGLFKEAFAEMANTRTGAMRLHISMPAHAVLGEIREVAGLYRLDVILPGQSQTGTPLATTSLTLNTGSSEAIVAPGAGHLQAQQELGRRLEELRAGIGIFLLGEEREQALDFLRQTEDAMSSRADRLDCTTCPPFVLEHLADNGFFGAIADYAISVGLAAVEVTLPPKVDAPPGLEPREGKLFVQL